MNDLKVVTIRTAKVGQRVSTIVDGQTGGNRQLVGGCILRLSTYHRISEAVIRTDDGLTITRILCQPGRFNTGLCVYDAEEKH